MATKKRRSYEFDPEVGREIEKQAQKQQEIEDRRKNEYGFSGHSSCLVQL